MAKKAGKKSKWAKSPKMAEFEDHRPLSQRFMRGLIPLVAILVVLYVAVQMLSRTEGCRALVAEQIEEHIDQPVSIEHMWTDWSLDLHASGLRTEGGFRNARPGLEVEEVIVRWKWPRKSEKRQFIRQIDVKGMKLSLVLDREHQWQPEAFAPLATWLVRWGRLNLVQAVGDDFSGNRRAKADSEKKEKESGKSEAGGEGDGFWGSVTVVLENSEVRWWDTDGSEAASAIGIRLQAIPLSVPQRDLHHYVVGIDRVRTALGEQVEDLNFELITTMGHHIVLGFKANWVRGATQTIARKRRPEPEPASAPIEEVTPVSAAIQEAKQERKKERDDQRSAEELADYFRDMLEGALMSD